MPKRSPTKLKLSELALVAEAMDSASFQRPLCNLCGLCRTGCKTPFMRPFVPKGWLGGKKILIIGEGPGEDEDERSGRPFTGKAGQLLRSLCRRAGLSPVDYALANAVRCRPPKNRRPRMREVRACRPFILQALHGLRPTTVIGAGETALRALTNQGGRQNVTLNRGKPLTVPGYNEPSFVIVTYHPSAILHGAVELEPRIIEDLKRASWPRLPYPVMAMPRDRAIGFDTEFAPDEALLTVGVASTRQAIAFDCAQA